MISRVMWDSGTLQIAELAAPRDCCSYDLLIILISLVIYHNESKNLFKEQLWFLYRLFNGVTLGLRFAFFVSIPTWDSLIVFVRLLTQALNGIKWVGFLLDGIKTYSQ